MRTYDRAYKPRSYDQYKADRDNEVKELYHRSSVFAPTKARAREIREELTPGFKAQKNAVGRYYKPRKGLGKPSGTFGGGRFQR